MSTTSEQRPAAYHLVMCSFDGTGTARRVVAKLKADGALEGCEIEGEALVSRERSGRVHLQEKGAAGVGATVGATTAGILGLVGGPVLLPILVVGGAVLGGVAGHFAGQVLPPEDLRRVGDALPPDGSAYLSLVDTAHARGVAGRFQEEGAQVLDVPVRTELSCAIREAVIHSIERA